MHKQHQGTAGPLLSMSPNNFTALSSAGEGDQMGFGDGMTSPSNIVYIYGSCWVAQMVVEKNKTNLQVLTLATLNIVYDELYCTSTKYCEALLVGAVAIILHTKLRGCFQS